MKTVFIPLFAVTIATLLAGCEKQVTTTTDTPSQEILTGNARMDSIINNTPVEELSNDEVLAILQMREEEKVARDLYNVAATLGFGNVFVNISSAESNHMTAAWALIEKYDLIDPVATDVPGEFLAQAIQDLYDQLKPNFQIDKNTAVVNGSLVEEVDIYDLRALKLLVDNIDINLVFDELEKGSRNHLRGFHQQHVNLGIVYTPQYLTQEEYDVIVNSPKEH